MRKFLRWLAYAVAAAAVLLLLFAGWVWYASARELGRRHQPLIETLPAPTPAQLADGPRQLRILGCVSCHGEGLRGDVMFDEPGVAKVWAPNLTHVAATASDQQLAQGIRQGIGHDGRTLWVMPSPMYSRLSGGEVAALIAAIRALPRAGQPTPGVSVGPLGRFAIVTGGLRSAPATLHDFRAREPIAVGPEHEAGRRLAATACSECHAPDLTGGGPGPSANSPDLAIAGAYDLDQFRTLMRTGRPPNGRDLGLMAEVARGDLAHYTDDEIAQLHAYLRARAERVPPTQQ